MKQECHITLVQSNTSDTKQQRVIPPMKERIYIALATVSIVGILLGSLILLPGPANAGEVFGVEFDNIDWAKLCPKVKPVAVGACKTVHPTSGLARKFQSGFESLSDSPKELNCDNQREIYEKRIMAKPRRCAAMFRTAYSALAISGQTGVFNAQEFRDTYLADGIVNLNALPNL